MDDRSPYQAPESSLFGEAPSAPAPPPAKPQGAFEQLMGLFSEPSEVFRRLRQSPGWVGALMLTLATALFASLAWAAKVDTEAMVKRRFEVMAQAFKVNIPDNVIDQELSKAATQGQPFVSTALAGLAGMPFYILILAAILFAFAKFAGEDEEVNFKHAWAGVTVHTLAMLPGTLLAGIMCLVRPVGGAPAFASLTPTRVAFWVPAENPWIRGLLSPLEPFYIFSFVALYLAARHTLRIKPGAAIALTVLLAFFGTLFQVVGGVF